MGVVRPHSDDGVHWGKPHMLMRSTVGASGVRSDDHPVDGFRLTRNKLTFDVDRDSTSALVKNGIERSVIDETSHGHTLLFTTGENISPIVHSIPAV